MGRQDCDRCGAEAKVGVDLNTGGSLLFCQHHYNENAKALAPIAVFVGQLGELDKWVAEGHLTTTTIQNLEA